MQTQTLVIGGAVVLAVLVLVVVLKVAFGGKSDAQKQRNRAHEQAQQRPPEEAAEKGETYELVVKETQYDRSPPEVRGTINGLQTFVREVPDPGSSDALSEGETVRVRVVDYGTEGTTAQAQFVGRA
ncbi:MAG: putative RNA-binding protein with TRAM domain [Natronomonas sp.]|jgi:predicted RNA-binding protein with TRAM domain